MHRRRAATCVRHMWRQTIGCRGQPRRCWVGLRPGRISWPTRLSVRGRRCVQRIPRPLRRVAGLRPPSPISGARRSVQRGCVRRYLCRYEVPVCRHDEDDGIGVQHGGHDEVEVVVEGAGLARLEAGLASVAVANVHHGGVEALHRVAKFFTLAMNVSVREKLLPRWRGLPMITATSMSSAAFYISTVSEFWL